MNPGRLRVLRDPGMLAVLGAAGLVITLHLVALGTAPPGLYNDEASIGYNAWAIAHHGVDEHGVAFPLYFEAFGEYKDPVSIYLLAPLTWVLPLTSYAARLPSALLGLGVVLLVARIATRTSGSQPVVALSVLTAGVLPWLFLDSRLAFPTISMVFALLAALWCLVHADESGSWRWFLGAGLFLGVALFTYPSARLFVALLAIIVAVAYGIAANRRRHWWALLPPVIAAYALLAQWSLRHPDALGARFGALTITADHPSLPAVAARFVSNYVQYFGFPFLFSHGDANLRHSTGWGGMLLVVSLPALLAGVVTCVRRLDQPLCRLALLGLVAAPIPAAVTAEGTPHSLRAATMLPFLLLLTVMGWTTLWPWLRPRGAWLAALAAVVLIEAGGYVYDFFVEYPGHAVAAFDSGESDAITRAHDLAAGHTVYLSDMLDKPYIQALFSLQPDPSDFAAHGLGVIGMSMASATDIADAARSGDILVLDPHDAVPSGATHLFDESVTVTRHTFAARQADSFTVVLVTVYRR